MVVGFIDSLCYVLFFISWVSRGKISCLACNLVHSQGFSCYRSILKHQLNLGVSEFYDTVTFVHKKLWKFRNKKHQVAGFTKEKRVMAFTDILYACYSCITPIEVENIWNIYIIWIQINILGPADNSANCSRDVHMVLISQ